MDKLDCINTFISVVENGNFSRASRNLGITRDQVAKRICYLESIFSTTLFIRNTRKMDLTSSGEKFYQHCTVIMSEYEWATNEFLYEQKYPEGQLKINAPRSFSQIYLTRIISAFMEKYPSIKIDLFLSDKFSEIHEDKYDLTLKISHKFDELNAHLFATYDRYLYATPAYLKKFGTPNNIEELKQHSLLFYSQKNLDTKVVLTKDGKQQTIYCAPKLTCNSGDFLLEFCKHDQGIIFLPDFLAQKDEESGKIVRCLQDYQATKLYFYAAIPTKQKTSKKVQLFLNYLKEYFPPLS